MHNKQTIENMGVYPWEEREREREREGEQTWPKLQKLSATTKNSKRLPQSSNAMMQKSIFYIYFYFFK